MYEFLNIMINCVMFMYMEDRLFNNYSVWKILSVVIFIVEKLLFVYIWKVWINILKNVK